MSLASINTLTFKSNTPGFGVSLSPIKAFSKPDPPHSIGNSRVEAFLPTVDCLNKPYSFSNSSSDGRLLKLFTNSTALTNSAFPVELAASAIILSMCFALCLVTTID